jgi:2-keto-3-deoxy-L-rhamnonate aldolase RhmA
MATRIIEAVAPSDEVTKTAVVTKPPKTRIAKNNSISLAAEGKICTAFGIKIIPGGEIVHIAKFAGCDSLFIDLEHTTLTIRDADQLCIAAVSVGITPFVRVPHQYGTGFMQMVVDAGAMCIIVPHIHGVGKS